MHPSGNSGSGGGGAGGAGQNADPSNAGDGGAGMQLPSTFRDPASTVLEHQDQQILLYTIQMD